MTTATAKMSTPELNELLHAHFIKPEDRLSQAGAGAVYLTEVTAPGGTRRADAVHIGLWQSRGAGRIDVCELKTSRSDFLRELDQPAKAEAWWPYSTTFSIVAPSTEIAPPELLPTGWGLLVPKANGRRFQTVVKPAEREPKLSIGLLLTLLKCTETSRTNALQQIRSEHARTSYQREQDIRKELASKADPDVRKRLNLLDEVEQHLGMPLSTYEWESDHITPEGAAAALKTFAAGTAALVSAEDELRRRAQNLDSIAIDIAQHSRALRTAIGTADQQQPVAAALANKEA